VVRVWDSVTGELLVQLDGHDGRVWSVGFDSDGGRVVSGGADGTVRVWDPRASSAIERLNARRRKPIITLTGSGCRMESVEFDRVGARILSGGDDGTVGVWDSVTGERLARLEGHVGSVRSAGFSPDGARVVSGGDDGTVRVWDSATGEPIFVSLSWPTGWGTIADGEVRACSPDAWEYLKCEITDPVTGRKARWPAEYAGPLPL
jgi:WD40 repeat protein